LEGITGSSGPRIIDGETGGRLSSALWPFARTVIFWWVLLVVIQQAQRVFLLVNVLSRDVPPVGLLLMTLATGVRADLVTAGLGILVALVLGALAVSLLIVIRRGRRTETVARTYVRGLGIAAALVAVVYFAVLGVDMGYYLYSGHRMDFVLFEYFAELIGQSSEGAVAGSQAGQQTAAELREVGKWTARAAGYLALQAGAIAAWWLVFTRLIEPALAAWCAATPRLTTAALAVAVSAGAWGLHPEGPDSVLSAAIDSSTYYILAQNPIWQAGNTLRALTRGGGVSPEILGAMGEARAARIAQETLVPGASFPSPRYPLVHVETATASRLERRPNVLLLFVEALDRRFLGRSYDGTRVTPFLDRLLTDSVYFENFFANGSQTFHGLFSSLCSALPRQGTAATKARFANDYLCLPTLLGRAGYATRMVIGQNRDRSHSRLGMFMARNGLDRLIDESGFPSTAQRMGLGVTDGALFDRLRAEIESLQAERRPYLLATLTTGTHHPFAVPDTHPDVAALRRQPDRYLAALRYLDAELERFLTGLQRDGLLRDTVVLILGDHGRHERVGRTELENTAGHFLSPLIVWMDPSLRSPAGYRPRVASTLASHVDLTPTILGLAGLTPRLSSFVGRDLSCAFVADCLANRVVYLSDVYDDGAGIVDRDGIWFYAFRSRTVEHADIALRQPGKRWPATDPAVAGRAERILALYVTANGLIERNSLWSWKEFGRRL
ncbi:MAG TPA: sulfatase-like hydrolase/transferase, partial [Methylomirabilota bacterium]|nr:sulfatase-like hydrolase/transferase [Methylomirabilota bacterium]